MPAGLTWLLMAQDCNLQDGSFCSSLPGLIHQLGGRVCAAGLAVFCCLRDALQADNDAGELGQELRLVYEQAQGLAEAGPSLLSAAPSVYRELSATPMELHWACM